MPTTTFFTAANTSYEPFVMPYIASVLAHNTNAFVEICLEIPSEFERVDEIALKQIKRDFGDAFAFRTADFTIPANHVRFVEEPREKLEFTYIGDIDILVVDDVEPVHRLNMARTGQPLSYHPRLVQP